MRLSDAGRIAAQALASRRGRTLKTMLSIGIGAFSIVVMYSLADSGLASLQRGFEEIGGSRLMFVYEMPPRKKRAKTGNYSSGITARDREAISDLPGLADGATYSVMARQDVQNDRGQSVRADLVASDAGLFSVLRIRVAAGRAFDDSDRRTHARVCVIGHSLRQGLGATIGDRLTVAGMRCSIVGELVDDDRWGVALGFDWQQLVLMPLDTVADRMPNVARESIMMLQTADSRENANLAFRIESRLTERHNGQDDFEVLDEQKDDAKWSGIFLLMKMIVGILAGVALIVGGIGVMNVMLVGVTERRREIGIRRALGARRGEIALQFLIEATLLAGGGGLTGGSGGLFIAALAGRLIHQQQSNWLAKTSYGAFFAAVVIAIVIGLVFGVAPARRAANVDPVVAIRG